jgi:hypothetical protein
MPNYDEFREMFANNSAEEKLAILRSEARQRLTIAYGFSLLINKLIEERKPPELPDDFGDWCKKVTGSLEELQDLIDALTGGEDRSVFKEERAKHDKEIGEMIWKSEQQGLPELQSYKSLGDALEQTTHKLKLSLFTPDIKIDESFLYPGGIVYFFAEDRRAHIGAQASQSSDHNYLGYTITLEWLIDKRNLKWKHFKGLTKSLDEAVVVLHHWLVEKQEFQNIQKKFQWMHNDSLQDEL